MKILLMMAFAFMGYTASAQTNRDAQKDARMAQEKKTEIRESEQHHQEATRVQNQQKGNNTQPQTMKTRHEKAQDATTAPQKEISPSNVEPDGVTKNSPGSGSTK